ncbi:MAG: hypothetical protein ACRCX2_20775 [Paraclostridium sp.]
MFTVIDNTTSKYRKVINENLGFYNLNTFYTFDNVFDTINKYLRYKTESFLGRSLIEVELPDRARSNQDITDSDLKKTKKNILPRAILMYDINPNDEDLVEIPTLKTHFAMNNGMVMELESIRRSKLDTNIIREFDFFRDIDVTVCGNITYTSALLYYTILLDNKIESIELMKQFKRNFPIQQLHDVYRYIVTTDDVTGKINNSGKITDEIELIPHTLKTVIPNDIIDKLKEVFEIDQLEDSDVVLEELMKKYSFNGLGREIDGSTRESIWFTRYQHVPILVPTSIERNDNVKDMSSTSAVRIEFQLNYIEVSAYKLTTKLKVLSPENPNNLLENNIDHTKANVISPLRIIPRVDEIEGCVEHFSLELQYDDTDINESGIMQLNLIDFVEERDKYFPKYMKWLEDSMIVDDESRYRVLIKHASNQTPDPEPDKSSNGCYYSYDDFSLYDDKSKTDDRVFVIVYVDMKLYVDWKRQHGFIERNNLSEKLMRR